MASISNSSEPDPRSAKVVIYALSFVVSAAALLIVYLTPRQVTDGSPSVLANLNAVLNAAAATSLAIGYGFIRKKQVAAHRACMLTAFGISALFLVTYLLHHGQVGSIPFRGEGLVRIVYFAILIPHIVLAALILPLALFTLYRGWSGKIASHRRIARWTLPLWMFVSVSGVVVYLMLYYAV